VVVVVVVDGFRQVTQLELPAAPALSS
jgi:hypothetical protein